MARPARDIETVTFGCRLNGVESDAMRREAAAAGLGRLTIVNTCAVTAEAVRQSAQAVRRAARERPDHRIVVTGCAAQQEPGRFATLAGVAALIGNAEKTAPSAWSAFARDGAAPPSGPLVSDVMATREARADRGEVRVRAFLAVQQGCDHRCTFCSIPFGRGASRSAEPEAVLASARALVAEGAREIVLTGVDLTAYGRDLGTPLRLGDLVRRILAACPDLPRLRLSSIDSVEADATLIAAFAEEPRLMPHLHLSLQAGDDLVLKRMKRRHLRADSIAFCRELRAIRPDMVFGADLIAGFPTETEEMFGRSLDLVEECGLTFLHVFPFSPRPGTPAARMPQLGSDLARERAARLREAGDAALARFLEAEIGRTREVLMETPDLGRTERFAPVRLAEPGPRGLFREVRIESLQAGELRGRALV